MLQGLVGLRELDLCGNQIRGRGALAVARAVAQLPHLTSLQLDENEMSEAAISKLKVGMQPTPGVLEPSSSFQHVSVVLQTSVCSASCPNRSVEPRHRQCWRLLARQRRWGRWRRTTQMQTTRSRRTTTSGRWPTSWVLRRYDDGIRACMRPAGRG